MFDHLEDVTADYNYTLVLKNQNVMPEFGEKKQIVHTFDDGSISITRMSDKSYFNVRTQFTALTIDDADIILDLWHDVNKANGRARTFYWQHPPSEEYYTVRFMDILTRKFKTDYGISVSRMSDGTAMLEIDSILLRIEGNKP